MRYSKIELRELKVVGFGVIVTALYWIMESANDAAIAGHNNLFLELWPSLTSEILLRFLVFLCITGFGVYATSIERAVKHIKIEKSKLITALSILVPICANCKCIRQEDDDQWLAIESFVQSRTGDQFTHTICPTCRTKLYAHVKPSDNKQLS